MKHAGSVLLCIVLSFSQITAVAQEKEAPSPIPLQLTGVTVVGSKNLSMTFGPSFCDEKGNIYTGEVEQAKRIQKFAPVLRGGR